MYGNEEMVGRAVRQSGLPREEIFLTTKLYRPSASYEKARQGVEDSLRAHELVKLNLLKSAPLTTAEAAEILAQETGSEIVHIIGHTFVLYRRSKKNLMGL